MFFPQIPIPVFVLSLILRIRCNGYSVGGTAGHQEIPDSNSVKETDKGQYGSVQKEKEKGMYMTIYKQMVGAKQDKEEYIYICSVTN